MEPPIIVDNGGDVSIFDSVEKAERYLEPIAGDALDHNMALNNPFGVNQIRNREAVGNRNYNSLDGAVQSWENQFGDQVRNARSADDFVKGLLRPGGGKRPYNSANPDYGKQFMNVYKSMLMYMKLCGIL